MKKENSLHSSVANIHALMPMKPCALTLLSFVPPDASAVVLDFEDFASPGSEINIAPPGFYSESGFKVPGVNIDMRVFDSDRPHRRIQNGSDK